MTQEGASRKPGPYRMRPGSFGIRHRPCHEPSAPTGYSSHATRSLPSGDSTSTCTSSRDAATPGAVQPWPPRVTVWPARTVVGWIWKVSLAGEVTGGGCGSVGIVGGRLAVEGGPVGTGTGTPVGGGGPATPFGGGPALTCPATSVPAHTTTATAASAPPSRVAHQTRARRRISWTGGICIGPAGPSRNCANHRRSCSSDILRLLLVVIGAKSLGQRQASPGQLGGYCPLRQVQLGGDLLDRQVGQVVQDQHLPVAQR